MPFKKVNVKEEINKRLENDVELKKAYDSAQHEYEVLKQLVKVRNEMGFSQSDVARKSGLTQQMVSRIETVGNSPTLRNFIRYIDGMGLEIKLEKKNTNREYERCRYCDGKSNPTIRKIQKTGIAKRLTKTHQ